MSKIFRQNLALFPNSFILFRLKGIKSKLLIGKTYYINWYFILYCFTLIPYAVTRFYIPPF
ncbi:hypothetical protein XBKB1_150020 [Xenorhabdus bovienii str. kraussei Becker Underwood]|uniref:Uncharacterized protein n=1 Tax=Xenorhabdus bovienii str. kraussei Becker Underwood TaxID=1398204 RepID=A0A077PQW1_XENBV|nr:hypothetical protein XBKB1_150020 [Xenorhabdus bovienii str. kraussei Becker Underwood]